MLNKSQVAILLYSLYLTLSFSIVFFDDSSFMFIALPALPWSIILVFGEDFGAFFLFGFMLVYFINSLILYRIFSKKGSRELYRKPLTIGVGIIPWSIVLFWYALTCSGKWCDLAALPAVVPGGYLLSLLRDEPIWNTFMGSLLTIIVNFMVIVLLVLLIDNIPRLFKRRIEVPIREKNMV